MRSVPTNPVRHGSGTPRNGPGTRERPPVNPRSDDSLRALRYTRLLPGTVGLSARASGGFVTRRLPGRCRSWVRVEGLEGTWIEVDVDVDVDGCGGTFSPQRVTLREHSKTGHEGLRSDQSSGRLVAGSEGSEGPCVGCFSIGRPIG